MSRKYGAIAEIDLVDEYLARIKKTPLLSAEEEIELARKTREGDIAARDKLVRANLRLVVKIAYPYARFDVSLMDLIQEGNLGLMHAAEKFDESRNVRFASYAAYWIKHDIVRFFDCKKRAIRLPAGQEERLRRIKQVSNYLAQQFQRLPTDAELASAMNMDAKEVRYMLELTGDMVPFEPDISNPDAEAFAAQNDIYAYSPEMNYMRECTRANAVDFISKRLPEREKKVLMYRFEFSNNQEPRTFEKIGEKIGVSPEAVRQIEMRALRKMRANAKDYAECLYA